MQNNINVLDEINKGATMGMDAIQYVYDKVGDQTFKKVLDGEYRKYKEIAQRISEEYEKHSIKDPHSPNPMEKAMTWYGIQMKTVKDQSNQKLSELLIQGTNMGIIEGVRLQNQNKDSDLNQNVRQILNDFVAMQEDSVETLKKYL
ncbi:MAG: hypothetical protein IKE01_03095 [Clostridia bacterium]|nr:hypothetical protein [Clostridia bacterium]